MRGRAAGGLVAAALALAAGAASLVAPGCDGDAPEPPRPSPERPPTATTNGPPARNYVFRWAGPAEDLPWNLSVYLTFSRGGVAKEPVPAIFDDALDTQITAQPGSHWVAHSELSPNEAIERLLWTFRAEGTLGDEEVVPLSAPQRTRVRLSGDESTDPGPDLLSVVDESSGARLAAVRDPLRGLHFGVWDAAKPPGKDDWRTFRHAAPTRPWTLHELRPGGTFVIAAKSGARRWIARRVTLAAGDVVLFDVAAQPEGGGRVVCEDAGAHLLLGGDLPVAPLRTLRAFYRATWDDVPPGRHAVRYPDGTVTPIDVAEGGEVKLPRVPPR